MKTLPILTEREAFFNKAEEIDYGQSEVTVRTGHGRHRVDVSNLDDGREKVVAITRL